MYIFISVFTFPNESFYFFIVRFRAHSFAITVSVVVRNGAGAIVMCCCCCCYCWCYYRMSIYIFFFFHFVQFLLMFLVRLANGNKMLSFRQTVSNPCSVVVCSLIVASVLAVVGVYGSKAWLLHERYKQIEMRKRNQTNIKLFLSHGFYLFVLSQHTTSVSIVVRWYSSDPWNFALFKLKSSIFKRFNW